MKPILLTLVAWTGMALTGFAGFDGSDLQHFITARDGRLFDGDKEFRFFSQNILNLIIGEMDAGGQAEFHAPPEGPDWMSAVDDADK